MNELNDISVSVFTAEDPVEGDLPGVTQAQVNTAVGYTFASVLRSLLRQDPDVILVGEIRDQETAEISIKAALTGHLVLSTLHTNCAAATISRLINMGIAPYLITSSVNCIVAQRLVRKICEKCKQQITLPAEALEKLGSARAFLPQGQVFAGKGCAECRNLGYKGRAPIYEILCLSDGLRRHILSGASKDEIKIAARREGMMTLREAALELVRQGITTLEEALSVTNEDPDLSQAPHVPVEDSKVPAPPIQGAATQTPHPPPTEPLPVQPVSAEKLMQQLGASTIDVAQEAIVAVHAAVQAPAIPAPVTQAAPVQAAAPVTGAASRWKIARPGKPQ